MTRFLKSFREMDFWPEPSFRDEVMALRGDKLVTCGEIMRDTFFSHELDSLPGEFVWALHLMPPPEDCDIIEGLTVSWFPAGRLRTPRFFEAGHIPAPSRARYHRPEGPLSHLRVGFVDAEELHFRTFENLVPLDRLIETMGLDISLGALRPHPEQPGLMTMPLSGAGPLLRLDQLGLYKAPLNGNQRGGLRHIFQSAVLAEALDKALGEALPPGLQKGFSHVNPVFRCNRFMPEDDGFAPHRDTPYYDAERSHISKYTLLLYLTGGEGAPALEAGGGRLERIPEMTAVLLDQRLVHAGLPYREGAKLFLRTELIYTEADLLHDSELGRMFSVACYMTNAELRDQELAHLCEHHAEDCFQWVAAARYDHAPSAPPPSTYLHKTFQGVSFLANGYDFWFAEGALPLEECAVVALMDYFNARMADEQGFQRGAAFRTLCAAQVLSPPEGEDERAWISAVLAPGRRGAPTSRFGPLPIAPLFPAPPRPSADYCCPFHTWGEYELRSDPDVVEYYCRSQDTARERMRQRAIHILGNEVFVRPENIAVLGDRIYIGSEEALGRVHFASCQSIEDPWEYVFVETRLQAPYLLVPPIQFERVGGCVRLMFDFFRNDWRVKMAPSSIEIPRV